MARDNLVQLRAVFRFYQDLALILPLRLAYHPEVFLRSSIQRSFSLLINHLTVLNASIGKALSPICILDKQISN